MMLGELGGLEIVHVYNVYWGYSWFIRESVYIYIYINVYTYTYRYTYTYTYTYVYIYKQIVSSRFCANPIA